MRVVNVLSLVLALNAGIVLAPVGKAGPGPGATDLFPKVPAGHRLYTAQIMQSGFVIGTGVHIGGGLILTARHVVEPGDGEYTARFELPEYGGLVEVPLRVDEVSYNHDVAVLRGDVPSRIPAAVIGKDRPSFGDPVLVLGCPAGVRITPTIGFYVGPPHEAIEGIAGAVMLSCQAYYGNSGGPVVDLGSGEVIGILVAALHGYPQGTIMIGVWDAEGIIARSRGKSGA